MACVLARLRAAQEAAEAFKNAASHWVVAASTTAFPARYSARFWSGHGHELEKTARLSSHHHAIAAARAAQPFEQASEALDQAIQDLAQAIAHLPLLHHQDACPHLAFHMQINGDVFIPLSGTLALHQGLPAPSSSAWQTGHVFFLSQPPLAQVLRILQSLRPEDISTPLINPGAALPFWRVSERNQRTHFVEVRARTPQHALAYAVSCENAALLNPSFHIAIEQRVDGVADMIQDLRAF